MVVRALRHYALVSEMMGVEGIVTAELALMIVNLQSLGLSVSLTSVPFIASASTSLVLIPLLGYITARCAKTAKQKAFSLIGVNLLQSIGVGLVILANVLRIIEGPNLNQTSENFTSWANTSGQQLDVTRLPFPSTTRSNSSLISTTPGHETTWSNSNSSDLRRGNSSTSFSPLENIIEEASGSPDKSAEGLEYYTILAMVGYVMTDCGYDTGSCFLKTFAMSATPSRDHPDVIVRAIQMSSLGGILVTLLGSVGVGEMLAEGTGLNVNSVTTIFILAVLMLIMLPTAILTLTTGLCCRGGLHGNDVEEDEERSKDYEGTKEEKQSLISDSAVFMTSNGVEDKMNQWQVSFSSIRNDDGTNIHTSDAVTRHRTSSTSHPSSNREVMEKIFQLSQSGAHSLMEEELNNASMKAKGAEHGSDFVDIINDSDNQGCFGKMRRFFKRQEKRLILCMGSFFALGALFSFNSYSVNFVTVSVCGGDLNAPPGSEKYDNYLRGIKIGSTGLLIFYASFVVGTTLQEFLLSRIGWWREASFVFVLYITCNITCAIVKLEEFYYVSALVSGLHRAVMYTVPYILVCRVLTETDPVTSKPKSENTGDIALMASMLPLSISLFSFLNGPLMEYTNDAALPIYLSGVSSFIGFILFSLLRKY